MTTPDKLSPDHQTELKALEDMPDDAIDTTDIPEATEWAGARRGALYRPVKRQVTIRLDADIIAWFQAGGAQGYQSRINAALREYIARHGE
ncbi:BrnA antitoxin family protein [uncultured Rhodospira sp.]|uniref:BrnA antitoxin family protein n=1 Tax=uncultured Rhodospira sp. TaxID=1936189 RepID=UPI002616D179|nr:BrnA antitoxin family protein [uncultured Rhodospira sp.]